MTRETVETPFQFFRRDSRERTVPEKAPAKVPVFALGVVAVLVALALGWFLLSGEGGKEESAPKENEGRAVLTTRQVAEKVQPSIVSLTCGQSIGSGFFISASGILVTNFHVLDGAYSAAIRTLDGELYPVETVLARSQLVDLIKVRVDIPDGRVAPIELSGEAPAVADRRTPETRTRARPARPC